ncbi:MAG: hypothetical protein ACRD3L_03170 [Terriglobales bacterium]
MFARTWAAWLKPCPRGASAGNQFHLMVFHLALRVPFEMAARVRSIQMQFLMTAISIIGGMAFSLAFAILVEEFIFGKVLGMLFARQALRVESQQRR